MKECRKCGETKPVDKFYRCKGIKDGFQSYCKECVNTNALEYRQLKQDRFLAYKKTLSCVRCGYSGNTSKLDFHHRDPSTKSFQVGVLAREVSRKRLQEEIAKCDVLCKACHNIVEPRATKYG